MSSKDKMIGVCLIIVGILFIAVGVMFGGVKAPVNSGNNTVYSESQNGQITDNDINNDVNNNVQVYSEKEENTQNPVEENTNNTTGEEEENGRYIY